MELILAAPDGREIRNVYEDIDIELGLQNDFELSVSYLNWENRLDYGSMLYVPGTEYGGIIQEIESVADDGIIYVRGDTWRGMLNKKVILPDAGQSYKAVSGELNNVLEQLIGSQFDSLMLVAVHNTEIYVTDFKLEAYCTLLEGINRILRSVEYRLKLIYIQNRYGGYVQYEAVPSVDYSDRVEMSQDSRLKFTCFESRREFNHMICLGKDDMDPRPVIHLYAQPDGSIGTNQYYKGRNERVVVYEVNCEVNEMVDKGTEKFTELMDYKRFEAELADVGDFGIEIGDTISGRDYITGIYVKKPVVGKVLKLKNQKANVEYKIEGE